MTTKQDITDSQIRTLREEALAAGDYAQVDICNRALCADDDTIDENGESMALADWTQAEARAECTRSIGDATAQVSMEAEYDAARIARAASEIGAVKLTDGRWAHYAAETSSWWVVSADELAELCDYLDDGDLTSPYSHWCAGTSAEEMPRGWTPNA